MLRHDWLWIQYKEIKHEDTVPTCQALFELMAAIQEYCEGLQIDEDHAGEGVSLQPQPAWKPLLKQLLAILHHVCPPTAVASGQRGVAHKVRAQCHSWYLETADAACLEGLRRSVENVCLDMGVEMGMPNFACKHADDVMPGWCARGDMRLDIEAGGGHGEEGSSSDNDLVNDLAELAHPPPADQAAPHMPAADAAANAPPADPPPPPAVAAPLVPDMDMEDIFGDFDLGPPPAAPPPAPPPPSPPHADQPPADPPPADPPLENEFYLDNAVPVYGMAHCVNIMTSSIHRNLPDWDWFHDRLKNMEQMLHMLERRQRFCWTCVRGTAYECKQGIILAFSATLYDKRWKEVVAFTKKLKSVVPTLCANWDSDKYMHGVDGNGNQYEAEDGFDPSLLTETLRSNFFHRMTHLVLEVESLPQSKLGSWSEACPCRDSLLKLLSESTSVGK